MTEGILRRLWTRTARANYGTWWVTNEPLPDGDWFRVVPRSLENVLTRAFRPPRIHGLLIADWTHAGHLGDADALAMSESLLRGALTVGTPGLTYEKL